MQETLFGTHVCFEKKNNFLKLSKLLLPSLSMQLDFYFVLHCNTF